jgi:hypothetical protein
MVELALKQIQKEDEEAENNEEFDIVDDEEVNIEELEKTLKDEDFEEFNTFLEEEEENDLETTLKEMGLDE